MSHIICPFCLKAHDLSRNLTCPDSSGRMVPASYVRNYRQVPPLWLATVGFTGHGKTTYQHTLMLTLDEISGIWGGYCSTDDQHTINELQHIRADDRTRVLPGQTQPGMPDPLLLNAHKLPLCGSRCLVMYDMAGETYDRIEDVTTYAAVLKHVRTTWFMVSLPDLEANVEGKTIQDLLGVYLSAMDKLQVDLTNRNLIVVYTKADKADIPGEVRNYVEDDPLRVVGSSETDMFKEWDTQTIQDYLKQMEEISHRLERFTRQRVPGGFNFYARARDRGLNLVFSAVSALGTELAQGQTKIGTKKPRLRVLDPLLWAIRLDSKPPERRLALILDGDALNFGDPAAQGLWDALVDQGDLSSYYLGQAQAVTGAGQRPPAAKPALSRMRLIGPLLERAAADTDFVVLVANSIHDLADFAHTAYRNRLLLVRLNPDHQPDWPHVISHTPGDDPNPVVDALLALSQQRKDAL